MRDAMTADPRGTGVALVHDWLTGMRGGEWVLEEIASMAGPLAPVHTLVHRPGSVSAAIESHPIRTSFLQRIPGATRHYRSWLPLMPLAAESFDLRGFDLVISSSHCVAKGVRPAPGAAHVSYLHTPMRYVWHLYEDYARGRGAAGRAAMALAAPPLRRWDVASSSRVDHFLANSHTVRRRIEELYGREAEVIHPPVDTDFFTPGLAPADEREGSPGVARPEPAPQAGGERRRRGDYYLVVSALVPYKRVEIAIEAFASGGRRLVIAGDGPDARRLAKLAPPGVEFIGWQSREGLRDLYRGARALVFPGLEDFGMTPVECMAAGTPVVAYGAGGVTESVVGPVVDEGGPTGEYVGTAAAAGAARPAATGVFFAPQTATALAAAIREFERMEFAPEATRARALEFGRGRFRGRFAAAIARFTGRTFGTTGDTEKECRDTRAS